MWKYALALGLLLFKQAEAVTVYVKPNAETCFFQEAVRGDKLIASFLVISGGFLDIDIKVTGPDTKVVYRAEKEREDDFQFYAIQSGPFKMCFGNTMSTVTGKTVSFNFYVGNALSTHGAATTSHLDPLEKAVVRMSDGLTRVHDSQNYIQMRYDRHAQTTRSTYSRLLWWAVLENLALIGVSGAQVFLVKRFFESTKSI